jgi:hypothetical protein
MMITLLAIISAVAGVAIAVFAQKVEAKHADTHSLTDWDRFVKTMGGGRK